MKSIIYVLVFASLLGICCKDNASSVNNDPFKPNTCSYDGITHFNIDMCNNDTISIKVKNQFLLTNDGFNKDDSVYLFPEIYIGDRLIFKNERRNSYNLKNNYKKVLKVQSTVYVLLKEIDNLNGNKFLIVQIKDDIISVFSILSEYFRNLDNDSFIEIGGFGVIEGYCYDCDSGYYSPAKIYEFNEYFKLDSVMSRQMTLRKYNEFIGYENKYVPVQFNKEYLESESFN